MRVSENRKIALTISLLLAALMAATRFHPIGSAVGLHDASLAVFFLSGLYLRSIFFPLFLAEATLIDHVVTVGGGDAWCITPAYLFLVPTYATLWGAGRWYARRHRSAAWTLMPLSLALFVGASAAFLISNAGFYLFSGYFGEMGFGPYAAAVAKYYPPYVVHAFFYVATAVCLHRLVGAIGRSKRLIVPTLPGGSQ
ncbi:MAG: hypothetical protein EPO39_17955 [Candidatus Manganitrophaceae bacterium]|nr:MAG: hypothetical protein EPO39_17955 [Candidatus Manganitrophaceae bacterium]